MFNFQRKLSLRIFQYAVIACTLQIICNGLMAQDNSPYSRYGLGDLSPNTNISSRGMAGLNAAYSEQPVEGLYQFCKSCILFTLLCNQRSQHKKIDLWKNVT